LIFENKQLAKWRLAIDLVLGTRYLARCDPLPTEQLERENRAEIGPDWTTEKHKKRPRQVCRQSFRIGVGLLFSTKRLGGWGPWLKDAGRGP
jgi:hypothetical protein